ncbi:Rho GTPase activating protein [Umbelopsis sp. WA50703]
MSALSAQGVDELEYLKSQNAQLWKVITKQKSVIHRLQKENSKLAAERDDLTQKLVSRANREKLEISAVANEAKIDHVVPEASGNGQERQAKETPSPTATIGPTVPPRSPYRQNSTKEETRIAVHAFNSAPSSPVKVIPTTERKVAPEPLILCNSPPSPVPAVMSPSKAIMDKDAQLFADFNATLFKRERQGPAVSLVNTTFPRDYQQESELQRQQAIKGTSATETETSELPATEESTKDEDNDNSPTDPIIPPSIPSELSSEPSSPDVSLAVPMSQASKAAKADEEHTALPVTQTENIQANDSSDMSHEAFASLSVKVIGSKIKSNERDKEVLCFIISVGRIPQAQKGTPQADEHYEELWRVEKRYSDFITLDNKMRSGALNEKVKHTVKFPEKSLFSTVTPYKVDQRTVALEKYLQQLISTTLDRVSDISEFLSTDVIQEENNTMGYKEGYLTKRGKNFGGWKKRYFIIEDHVLNYYDTKNGSLLGYIQLRNSKIGRQAQQTPTDIKDNRVFRHAFLILEQKKSGSNILGRHILCAQSDVERDEWIDALVHHVNIPEEETSTGSNNSSVLSKLKKLKKTDKRHKSTSDFTSNNDSIPTSRKTFEISGTEDARFADLPFGIKQHRSNSDPAITPFIRSGSRENPPFRSPPSKLYSNPEPGLEVDDQQHHSTAASKRGSLNISRTTKDMVEHQIWNTEEPQDPVVDDNKMNSSSSPNSTPSPSGLTAKSISSRVANWRRKTLSPEEIREEMRPTTPNAELSLEPPPDPLQFGIPLESAVEATRSTIPCELPAIVYRCIEYLDANNAVLEEGIYRQSGSTSVINELRQRFDRDGDYNILETNVYYDVHAVAGLLKLWLRELPTLVLTAGLHEAFLCVMDLLDPEDRLKELGRLVSLLPVANYTLLRALSAHILQVVQNSAVNKMTLLNVGIVFALTLGIPGSMLNMLLTEYEYVFLTEDEVSMCSEQANDAATDLDKEDSTEKARQEEPIPRFLSTLKQGDDKRSNRNSMMFLSGAPNAIKHIEKNLDTKQSALLSDEDESNDSLSVSESEKQ